MSSKCSGLAGGIVATIFDGSGGGLRRYDKDGALIGLDLHLDVLGDDAPEPRKEQALHCAVCGHRITRIKDRTLVNGRHLYVFTNPLGVTYRIGCFRAATGCQPEGPSSFDYTWFPGYSWQIQRCGSCHLHMGWRFQGDDSAFYGLVLKQLVESESGDG